MDKIELVGGPADGEIRATQNFEYEYRVPITPPLLELKSTLAKDDALVNYKVGVYKRRNPNSFRFDFKGYE